MPGGLMQLKARGNADIILTGNPTKTFFKSTYLKHTDFSLQKFRVDFNGSRTLRLTEESKMTFKIPRHADLLMDAYISVNLPNIWSPIMPPESNNVDPTLNTGLWVPYEFKWIEHLGAMMISNISITCGNYTIQEYSGEYMLSMVQRDFPKEKKDLFYRMIGHLPEYNDPANFGTRVNTYPNAYYTTSENGAEPSIRGRQLLIPLNAWFCLKTTSAIPLISLQYNEMQVHVTFRPIQQLFKIRDVLDSENNYPYVAPNFNQAHMQFYRFLQTPPDVAITDDSYDDTRTLWNADIHLMCTYCFLTEEERRVFSANEQTYLFKQVKEYTFKNVVGTTKVSLDTLGLIPGMMFLFKRSDVFMRNEWSNKSNWPYNYLPYDIRPAPTTTQNQPTNITHPIFRKYPNSSQVESLHIAPGVNVNGDLTGWHITGDYQPENTKHILESLAIMFDGEYRENTLPAPIFNYVEKYARSNGNAEDGLYWYSFALNDSPFIYQPTGAANLTNTKKVELEMTTIVPPLDPYSQTLAICDPESGVFVGVNKPTWRLYDYSFDLTIFQERYNMLHFTGGNCGLTYAT
uniref:Major capsid protein N-terminal domain-containing protein n=1 Tax=viral metagenome TaxID=1070528 RepID=A0A6C0FDQ7_9ZZZZ|tara:strand:+ start:7234 stop:8952 length:1719 start_codon:yes stop_codon:yes gene_type:complete